MHGMVNRALQGFIVTNYGADVWAEVSSIARLPEDGFEAMHTYDHALTLACFGAAVDVLGKRPNALLEDIGIYLITDPVLDPLRRLLRFGGGTFAEFLVSLEELPDRTRLAMPELEMPEIRLEAEGGGQYLISARWPVRGSGRSFWALCGPWPMITVRSPRWN